MERRRRRPESKRERKKEEINKTRSGNKEKNTSKQGSKNERRNKENQIWSEGDEQLLINCPSSAFFVSCFMFFPRRVSLIFDNTAYSYE